MRRARMVTGPAVVGGEIGIKTRTVALNKVAGTDTRPVDAVSVPAALVTARSTVIVIALEIDTGSIAERRARIACTCPAHAMTKTAGLTTGAAVFRIGKQMLARLAAAGVAGGARLSTDVAMGYVHHDGNAGAVAQGFC